MNTMTDRTLHQYQHIVNHCKDIFLKKMQDYGSAWRILRPSSITDQIFIKAQRIRSIEEKQEQKIDEGVASEYAAIVNYSAIALMQLQLGQDAPDDIHPEIGISIYENILNQAYDLMLAKNHDYGEAWREMRISSMTDLILMKIKRIKQIEDNSGATLISEGVEAGYFDMINYAIFALIRLNELQTY